MCAGRHTSAGSQGTASIKILKERKKGVSGKRNASPMTCCHTHGTWEARGLSTHRVLCTKGPLGNKEATGHNHRGQKKKTASEMNPADMAREETVQTWTLYSNQVQKKMKHTNSPDSAFWGQQLMRRQRRNCNPSQLLHDSWLVLPQNCYLVVLNRPSSAVIKIVSVLLLGSGQLGNKWAVSTNRLVPNVGHLHPHKTWESFLDTKEQI